MAWQIFFHRVYQINTTGGGKAVSMLYRNKADLVLLDGSSFNSGISIPKSHISSMNYLPC